MNMFNMFVIAQMFLFVQHTLWDFRSGGANRDIYMTKKSDN